MFDIPGVLILVVLIAVFGFLATRAWRLKNGFLKWGGTILAGLLTLIPAALLALALVGFYKLNQQHANPVANIQSRRHACSNRPRPTTGQHLRELPYVG